MISVFGQWSGNGLGYFNSTIYDTLGYKTSSMQLLLNLINQIVSAIAAGTAVCLTDLMPRRPVLIWGTLGTFKAAMKVQTTNFFSSLCHHHGHQRRHL